MATRGRRRRGWLVSIEGPEGAGKTTQAERLGARATEVGIEVVVTREPGGTPVGERVRAILLDPASELQSRTDALLFNAARAQLVAEVIRPGLEAGRLVVATRFVDSTLAYQGYGAGVPLDDLRAIARFATDGLRPDLTIVLDLPPGDGLARKTAERTRFESTFGLDFHERVRQGFLELAALEPDRFAIVDASGGAAAVERHVLDAVSTVEGLERLSDGSRPPR